MRINLLALPEKCKNRLISIKYNQTYLVLIVLECYDCLIKSRHSFTRYLLGEINVFV